MSLSFKRVAVALAAILLSVAVFAQVTTSSLTGRVIDESGESLPGAVVQATHNPTGSQYYAVTNNEGRFNIGGMRTGGPYTVEVSYVGMSTLDLTDIMLKLGEAYEISAVLQSSNELDAVVFVSEKNFNASKTGAGAAFNSAQVESMPTIDRSIYDVVKYTPQATVNKNGGISFAGANNRYNSFQIDGAVANDSFGLASSGTNGGQTGANPIALDAIEEIQVVVAPFDVRQSGFTGGAINAITKSGTNEVKGSFYTRYYNQDFIGTTPGSEAQMQKYFNKTERTKYEDEASANIGFTVGAPVIKNKLFLFLSGDYNYSTYPTAYSPANDGYLNKPLSEAVTWKGEDYGDVLNSKMADAILKKYEETYGTGLDPNYSESYSIHQKADRAINVLARVDWNINDNNKLMLRYQLADARADKFSAGASSYTFNNSAYYQANRTNTFVGELHTRLNDNMSNELRATAVLVRDHRDPGYAGATMYIRDNITINLGTEYSSGANSMDSDTYTLTDNFSWYLGNHNITIGTHNELFKFNNVYLQYAYGEYVFSTLSDYFNDKPNTYYYNFADPQYTGGATIWAATTWAAELGLYAQDEWKPNNNLTVTYGLRVDFPMLINKPIENTDFNTYSDSQVEAGYTVFKDQYVGTVPNVTPLWSPRLGFRYYLNDSRTSLLRGGVGLFTGRVPFAWLSNAYNNTGVATKSTTLKKDLDRLYQAQYSGAEADGMATSSPYTYVKNGLLSAGTSGLTINTMSKNFKYPQVFRVNLGYDQEFSGGWKFTFDALYSKTLNNVFFYNLVIDDTNVIYPVSKAASDAGCPTAPYYTNISGETYSTVVALGNTNLGYTYSLSAQVQKSFDFGLDLTASYTYGHAYAVNDATSSVAYSNWKYNYTVDSNHPELSYSMFDKPHKVTGVISYTTPKYFGGRASTNIALTYQGGSGQRYSYTMRENEDFNGDGYSGNTLLYIPTEDQLPEMKWVSAADAAKFEEFIASDKYLSTHRGQWSERNGGIAPWENHFDLHVSENVFYDAAKKRKVELTLDLINASNLLNRSWGIYYGAAYNRQVLNVTAITFDEAGNATPTYSYNATGVNTIPALSDFYSRWRFQLGLRLTF